MIRTASFQDHILLFKHTELIDSHTKKGVRERERKKMLASYSAFKAHALLDLNAVAHSGCVSFRQQQRLLRVHLRHLLLTGGGCEDKKSLSSAATSNGGGRSAGGAVWMDGIKRSAATGTAAKAPLSREGSQHDETQAAAYSEQESANLDLKSTSQFVPFKYPLDGDTTLGYSTAVHSSQNTLLQQLQKAESPPDNNFQPFGEDDKSLHPFELSVELLSARDLAPISSAARVFVGAELSLKHQTRQIAAVSAKPSAYIAAIDGMVHWDRATLRFGFDPEGGDSVCRSPQSAINEWSLSILVKVFDSGLMSTADSGKVIGKLEVPLFLLETPLAQEYALVRWFPLERTAPGVPTRGGIRLSIAFSMREEAEDEGRSRMVAYKPKLGSDSTTGDSAAMKKTARGLSKLPRNPRKPTVSSKKLSVGSKSKASPRPGQPRSLTTAAGSSTLKPSQPPKKAAAISPGRQRPKVEAFSPPSSPSSFSSESLDEQSPRARSRSPLQRAKRNNNSMSSSTKPKRVTATVGDATKPDGTATSDSASSSQPFLKRKPYKVVFRKLDWSSVTARTDSSWDAKNPPGTGTTATTTGPKSPSGNRAPSSSTTLPTKADKSIGPNNSQQKSAARKLASADLNPVMANRLQALSRVVYECCAITQETAALAHMKYQAERNKYLIQQQVQPAVNADKQLADPSTPTEANCDLNRDVLNSILASKPTLSSLWKALLKDASGELYAAKLQQLLSGFEHMLTPGDLST